MNKKLRKIINKIDCQIKNEKSYGDEKEEPSWHGQHGILISCSDAEELLNGLDQLINTVKKECAKENNIDYFVDEVEKIAQEFVLKVDSGRARSKVTYGHMLRLLAMIRGIRGLQKFYAKTTIDSKE